MVTFERSVQAAVAASLAQKKPLLVVLSETEELPPDSVLTQAVNEAAELITEQAVSLKVLKDSPDFDFFRQIFPVGSIPSLYIIRSGKVVALITGGDSTDHVLDQLTTAIVEASNEEATNEVKEGSTNEEVANEEVRSPRTTNSQPDDARPGTNQATPKPRSSSQDKSKPAAKPRSKSTAQEEYQQQLRLQKKAQDDERKRILELVRKDREEQRARNEQDRRQTATPKSHPKPHVDHHNECAILIRLFDGSPLKNRFKPSDTLESVRQYVDSTTSITDPYHFAQTYPKRTFSVSEEHQTLQELGLVPSATLILKPISQYVSAYSQSSSFGGWLSPSAWYTSISNGISQYLAAPENDGRSSESSRSSNSDDDSRRSDDREKRNTYNGNQLSLEDNNRRP
ncbi:UBX domain-containing protein 7 [Trichomonascus vanleenenianus]|uniref:Ubx6p n=1 Tax=Trichomonascus vanleenenianus TaxID=2268995 RepID=UPI003ECA6FC8